MSAKTDQAQWQAKLAFAAAMTKAQLETAPICADANNPLTQSTYASHQALDRVLRPIYTANGFALCFNTGDGAPTNHVRVICDVSHVEGHEKQFHVDIPCDGKGIEGIDVMTKTHAAVSAVSIGIRALLRMIFNIVIDRSQDDDGNAAGVRPSAGAQPYTPAPGCISNEQARQIVAELNSRVVSGVAFLQWAGVDHIGKIPVEKFDSCIAAIGNFKKKAA
ncbi:hypothetical protein ONR75_15680 [Rhodopseudomonas sp. P2A-2r]|uniref:ERF family protein n=1 Tax=Rhodopseudomonas sp. P2A-2r TaxID=2991972 RepID=UPI0022341D84|nr:ERF family protein [Rhodopseudomonas sp. P2A-2r]UZE51873.1 hypothetical protein ONR75_15680 [Rhodopseudomonas sp. P2A-2r]